MNDDAKAAFTQYFGNPETLKITLTVLLVVSVGIAVLIIIIKVFNDRQFDKEVDENDVFVVIARALAVLLVIVAVFSYV